jgi:hypothetical protein|tara:strand:+ start:246 stop:500 length:255 start_codon:yes stop_codon:yes gene_type:complete
MNTGISSVLSVKFFSLAVLASIASACTVETPVFNEKGIQQSWMDFGISTGTDPQLISLIWALFYTFFIYFIVKEMYKRKIFVKI